MTRATSHRVLALCAAASVYGASGVAAAQGRLSQALDEAAGHPHVSSSRSSSNSHDTPSSYDGSRTYSPSRSDAGSASSGASRDQDSERDPETRWYGYAPYPYAIAAVPYVLLGPKGAAYAGQRERPAQRYAGRLGADTGYAYGVVHAHARGQLLTPMVFELSLGARVLYEPALQHTAAILGTDIVTRFWQRPAFSWSVLAGARYFGDVRRGYFGAVAGMSFEFFDPKPLVITIAFEAGALGRAPHVAARLQVGIMLGPLEIYGGGELMLIGEVPFHRPVLGARAWL